jgi:hypothetical protein
MPRYRFPALFLLLAASVCAQSLSSLTGAVTDPSGASIPGATVTAENTDTGFRRTATSDAVGVYAFPQLTPGPYKITAKAPGFTETAATDVRLLVNSPVTLNLKMAVGAVQQSVEVTDSAVQVNTQDATLGNAFGTRPVLQLPFEARNIVGLLSLQPGVSANGSVNGGKSDQANVTLDGVDVNDQQYRSAFTSVLRVTLDSVQEFRVTTSGANADMGRSSGAQIALVTKSGTNEFHGSAYEYLRNTLTAANSFFNNAAGIPRPDLKRNVFGASGGGPVKKDRLFLFGNYEGRRDASQGTAVRTVPTAAFRQGLVSYLRKDGSVGQLKPGEITALDPLSLGANAAVLKVFQAFPLPNDFNSGDGLNTAGLRFNAPLPLRWNTYTARMDYNPTDSGRHALFLRASLQNDHSNGMPQFPGAQPNSVNLSNSKGLAAGYTLVLRSNLNAAFRYGFTRQGVESSGVQPSSAVSFYSTSDLFGLTTGLTYIIPVHHTSQDFNWIKDRHTVQFGATQRKIADNRINFANSFHYAQTRASRLKDAGASLDPADISTGGRTNYRNAVVDLLGIISTGTANYNYDLKGNVQAVGTPVKRKFRDDEYEMYVQDTWRLHPSLNIVAGLRYSLMPPLSEANGMQIAVSPSLGAWFDERGGLAQRGLSQNGVAPLKYIPVNTPGAPDLYNLGKKNFAPRLAIAYSPEAGSGWKKRLFGGTGKTAIRAGAGMFYDLMGQSLIRVSDNNSFGLQTAIQTANGTFTETNSPRFTGIFNLPPQVVVPAPVQVFPVTAPNSFAYGSNIDPQIRPAYSMNLNFSIAREFGRGLMIQGAYVGRLSRRSLIQTDVASPTDLVDPASGMDYFGAATRLAKLIKANTPVASVPNIAYWENLWPGAAGSGLTATQAVYKRMQTYAPDYTTALQYLDQTCSPACSKLGPSAMYNQQFSSFTAWRSLGKGNYHAMQWTLRQHFSRVEWTVNYTWAKSIDLSSRNEDAGTLSTYGFITNPWNPSLNRAVSDYDMAHQLNANFVVELPFGHGRKFLNQKGVLDAVLGGWQLSGIYRQTSGLPISVSNGRYWPTNYQWQGFATPIAPIVGLQTTKNAPAVTGPGGPNLFVNPAAALATYDYTDPGGIGQRNFIRGQGSFTIDSGLSKRFVMPYSEKHSIQFRAEAFNITNTVRFDPTSASLSLTSPGTFGKLSGVLNGARVMQFGARYEW